LEGPLLHVLFLLAGMVLLTFFLNIPWLGIKFQQVCLACQLSTTLIIIVFSLRREIRSCRRSAVARQGRMMEIDNERIEPTINTKSLRCVRASS
jgi:hypothetical protein